MERPISIRLYPRTLQDLDYRHRATHGSDRRGAIEGGIPNRSEAIRTCLERYFDLLANCRSKLRADYSNEEMRIICDASSERSFDLFHPGIIRANVLDHRMMNQVWKIPPEILALASKLDKPTELEEITMIDAIEMSRLIDDPDAPVL